MAGDKEYLDLAHARPGCGCRTFAEEPFVVEGTEYRVRVPVCRSGPGHAAALVRLVEQVAGYTLLHTRDATHLLRRHLLDVNLLKRVEPAAAHRVSLRSLARVTRSCPRRRCHWCNRRFNARVGPARPAELVRLWGQHTHTVTVLACSPECWRHVISENVEYLSWLASELAVVRALKKQLQALNQMARQMAGPRKEEQPPASMSS